MARFLHLLYMSADLSLTYDRSEGALTMVPRLVLLVLCLGILSTVNGCSVDSPPLYGTRPSYGIYRPQESGTDYEKKMDEEEQHYRNQRREQERAQEQWLQQWEEERQRRIDPRWERN